MRRINEEESRTIHTIEYSLKDYDMFAGFDAIVRLKPENDSKRRRNNEESKEESKSTDSSKQDESKESKNKNKIEERESGRGLSSSGEEESILSHAVEKNTFVTFVEEPDSEKDTFVFTSSRLSHGVKESNRVCAKCGEDLTGKGTVTKNGVSYCARPGCGYPPRGEA